jgi:hypothetical protein
MSHDFSMEGPEGPPQVLVLLMYICLSGLVYNSIPLYTLQWLITDYNDIT